MNLKRMVLNSGKVVLLGVALYLINSLAYAVASSITGPLSRTIEITVTGHILFLMQSTITAAILCAMVSHSRLRGFGLILLTGTVLFLLQTFLNIAEVLFFNISVGMTRSDMYNTLISGFLGAVVFAPVVTMVFGRHPRPASDRPVGYSTGRLLLASSVVYPLTYFAFGFLVTLFPAHAEYYRLYNSTPSWASLLGLMLFQVPRGMVFTFMAVLIDRNTALPIRDRAILTGLVFSVLMSVCLVGPNPFMPANIRIVHFFEIFFSNLLWGTFAVWFLNRPVGEPRKVDESSALPAAL